MTWDDALHGFAVLGIIFSMAIIIFFVFILCSVIKDFIEKIVYRYQYKHRFSKPPLAKCYCKDCSYWNPETGECSDSYNSRNMSPAWFCCFADPLTVEEMKRRKEK